MRIGNWEFQKKDTKKETVQQGEVAYNSSTMYMGKDFDRYNPDDLLGRKGTDIYRKMMQDDQVKSLSQFLKFATLARGFHFRIEDNPEAERQQEFADWVDEMIDSFLRGTWTDKLLALQTAHDFGFAMVEKVWSPWEWQGQTYWGLRDLKLRPFDSFVFKTDPHGNTIQVKQTIAGGEDLKIDPKKFVHAVNNAETDPQYGRSDLRDCYRAWWSKDVVIKFWNLYLERMAGGFVYAQQTGPLSPQDKTDLDTMLDNLAAGSAFRLPSTVDFNVQFPGSTDAYEKAIQAQDKAIAKALLVPSLLGLSEQGQTGSYSQSQTQLETFFFTLDARATRLSETISEQVWKELARWNFGLKEPPKYIPQPMTHGMKVQLADSWTRAIQGGSVMPDAGSEKYVRELLGFPVTSEVPAPDMPPDGDGKEEGTAEPTNGEDDESESKATYEEGESPQLRRVAFRAIDRDTGRIERKVQDSLTEIMLEAYEGLKAQAGAMPWGTAEVADDIAKLKFPKKGLSELRKSLRQGLLGAWKVGKREAKAEVPFPSKYSTLENPFPLDLSNPLIPAPGMDDKAAETFLKAKSFSSTQKLSEDALAAMQNTLYNGMKYDQTWAEIVGELDKAVGQFVPTVDAAGRAVNVPARLATIARTNTFEAVNEARLSHFRDPEMNGFVEGLEYSAILDSRTSDICNELDGYKADLADPVWDGIRPPNHFNCRSLLVALTEDDYWQPSGEPKASPAKGFGTVPRQTLDPTALAGTGGEVPLEVTKYEGRTSLRTELETGNQRGVFSPTQTAGVRTDSVAINIATDELAAQTAQATPRQSQAIKTFTAATSDYKTMRALQRGSKRDSELLSIVGRMDATGFKLDALSQAVEECEGFIESSPKYEGTVFRGVKKFDSFKGVTDDALWEFIDEVRGKGTYSERCLASSSTDMLVSADFSNGVILEIELTGKNAANVVKYSSIAKEREILISSKARFKVESVQRIDGVYKASGTRSRWQVNPGMFIVKLKEI